MKHIFTHKILMLCVLFLALMFILLAGCGGEAQQTAATAPATVNQARSEAETAAVPSAGSYIFAVCGDNRTVGIDNGTMDRIVQSARSMGAAFMVDTGDVTDGGTTDELVRYRDFTEASGLRFYTVPGNHDVGKGGVSNAYSNVLGATYFSFDFGGDHFVVLDNADDKTGMDDAETAWMEADLAANRDKKHQFVFAHIPIASPTLDSSHVSGEGGAAGLKSGQHLAQVAENTANIADLFFGHIHAYIPYRIDSLQAYITGGAGAPLYEPEILGGYFHFLLVTVSAEGVNVEVVRV